MILKIKLIFINSVKINMRNYEPFLDHVSTMEYKTLKIGEGLEKPEDITRSHFKNVTEYVEVT